jgi:hypothetical protein
MRKIIWAGFIFLALLWTGAVALFVELVEWSAHALASGDGGAAIADSIASAPIPDWLAPWVDLSGWREWLQAITQALEWISGILPVAGQSLAWVVPVIWAVWAVGLLGMLVITLIGARLAARS